MKFSYTVYRFTMLLLIALRFHMLFLNTFIAIIALLCTISKCNNYYIEKFFIKFFEKIIYLNVLKNCWKCFNKFFSVKNFSRQIIINLYIKKIYICIYNFLFIYNNNKIKYFNSNVNAKTNLIQIYTLYYLGDRMFHRKLFLLFIF